MSKSSPKVRQGNDLRKSHIANQIMKPSNAYSAKDLQNLNDKSLEGKKLLNNLIDNGPRNKQNLLGLNMNFQE